MYLAHTRIHTRAMYLAHMYSHTHTHTCIVLCVCIGAGLAYQQTKEAISRLLLEYEASRDAEEARACLRSLHVPFFYHEVCQSNIIHYWKKRSLKMHGPKPGSLCVCVSMFTHESMDVNTYRQWLVVRQGAHTSWAIISLRLMHAHRQCCSHNRRHLGIVRNQTLLQTHTHAHTHTHTHTHTLTHTHAHTHVRVHLHTCMLTGCEAGYSQSHGRQQRQPRPGPSVHRPAFQVGILMP